VVRISTAPQSRESAPSFPRNPSPANLWLHVFGVPGSTPPYKEGDRRCDVAAAYNSAMPESPFKSPHSKHYDSIFPITAICCATYISVEPHKRIWNVLKGGSVTRKWVLSEILCGIDIFHVFTSIIEMYFSALWSSTYEVMRPRPSSAQSGRDHKVRKWAITAK
jgi:hypothetical protein